MKLPPELEKVRRNVVLLRDRVLVRPLPYEHPILATVGVDVQKGVVVAVGYGRRQRKRTPFHQKEIQGGRTLWFEDGEETGRILPMKVEPGQVVEFSPRNYTKFDFDRLGFPGVGDLIVLWQNAIMTIDPEESAHESMLWMQSAGYDRNGNYLSGAEQWQR